MATSGLRPGFFQPGRFFTRELLSAAAGFLIVFVVLFTWWPGLARATFEADYMPHSYCYLGKPDLIWTHVVADSLIGISYFVISATLVYLIYKGRRDVPFRWIFLAFGLFIVACGATHFMEVLTVWIPVYVFSAWVKILTALASVGTAVVLPKVVPEVFTLVRQAQTSEEHRKALERTQKTLTLEKLALEHRVHLRTAELTAANEDLKAEIAGRQLIEMELARTAAIVESSDDAIIGQKLDGTIVSWNRSAERIYGYTAEEMIGRPISLLTPVDQPDEVPEILRRLQNGQRVGHYETLRLAKGGRKVPVSMTFSPIRDLSGEVVGASKISRDITERRNAEQVLKELEEAQYRVLFENNPLPMWVFDRKTLEFLAVNEAAIGHYGYSRDEFLSMTTAEIRPEEDVSKLIEALSERVGGLSRPQIWRHRKKDGTVIMVEITSNPIDMRGRSAELVLAHDVTEQRKNEESLRQSEERFAKAFRSSPMAITITTEKEGRYLDTNDAFLKMMGYQREEMLGRTSLELRVWADPQDRHELLRHLDQAERAESFEARFLTKTGEQQLVRISAERIVLDGIPCVLANTLDITEARRMEQQLRQAQKMEAVGRLAGGVAHDFNNLLGVILGYTELTREVAAGNNVVVNHVDQIRKAVERAAGLTRQLLAFSRKQVLQPRVLDLNAVVHDISKMLKRMVGEDISLTLRPGAPLGSIKADPGQIEQVLMNLVVNARDAMAQGGKVVIETANTELDEAYAEQHPGVRPGPYVMLSVSDTGCGMDATTMAQVFEPFFTTKGPGQGTGLGLSTVYGIVKQSDGYIWVYSEPGKGTMLKIYFPHVDAPAEPLVQWKAETISAEGTEKVLLVEDDEALRRLTAALLESAGYTVLQADSAEKAIAVVERDAIAIDLLLTDVIMPEMSGGELAARLHAARPDLKVLYMSGYTGDLIARHGPLGQGALLVEKPFTRYALLTKMREALET